MTDVVHHPADEMLLDYSTGALDYESSLLIASHLTFCVECRHKVRQFEQIGGAVLALNSGAALARGKADHALVSSGDHHSQEPVFDVTQTAGLPLPRPLAKAFAAAPGELRWTTVFPGVKEIRIPPGATQTRARLLSLAPGRGIPQHTHEGLEMTLVLSGAFRDEIGHFRRGDVACSDADITHRPVADQDGECICFAVSEAPMRLNGPLGQILNIFTGR